MKSFLAAAALALPLAFTSVVATAPAADAKTKVRIYLGIPYYAYNPGAGYYYRNGYGWYRPAKPHPGPVYGKMSCGMAASIVRNKGYRNVSATNCSGSTYSFRATRNGYRVQVLVNSRTGAVWRG